MDADKKMKEIRKISENASEWYDAHLKETLDEKLAAIEAIFKELATNYAPAYHLVHQNESSKEIKLWLISSRVKGASSLAEKIIRGQQFYDLDLSTDETSEATILANNDDLIGLRYLVSLSCDCASVFQMICDHYDELAAKNITFSNLKSNPEIMHNGREIYRLKGRYEDKYPFELQIKSKIDSAWADEEHMLFYKESRYSYIQKSQRAIMNQVGELLDQADKLMCLIRHSHDEYTPDEIWESEFYQKLENRYAPVLREAISNTILLKQYRTAFYYYFNVWGEKSRKSFLRRMTEEEPLTSINSFMVDEDVEKRLLWKNYEALKESCLEFILAEHISGDWLSSTPPLNEPLTFRRLCAYIVKMTECFCLHLLKDSIESEEDLKAFAKWMGNVLLTTLIEQKKISFQAPLLPVNANKLYMLYSYWKALSPEPYAKLKKEKLNEINVCVVLYMLGTAKEDAVKMLQAIGTDIQGSPVNHKPEFKKLLSPAFAADFQKIYEEKKSTSTGKKMKTNLLLELFEAL